MPSVSSPDAFGWLGLVVSVVTHAVVVNFRDAPIFNTADCPVIHDNSTAARVAALTACLSAGGALLAVAALLSRPGMRRPPTRSALVVMLACVVRFVAVAADASPYVCVRAVGGLSADLRPQQPLELVCWVTAAVPEMWSLAFLAGQSLRDRIAFGAVMLVLFGAGTAATFTESFGPWVLPADLPPGHWRWATEPARLYQPI